MSRIRWGICGRRTGTPQPYNNLQGRRTAGRKALSKCRRNATYHYCSESGNECRRQGVLTLEPHHASSRKQATCEQLITQVSKSAELDGALLNGLKTSLTVGISQRSARERLKRGIVVRSSSRWEHRGDLLRAGRRGAPSETAPRGECSGGGHGCHRLLHCRGACLPRCSRTFVHFPKLFRSLPGTARRLLPNSKRLPRSPKQPWRRLQQRPCKAL